MKQLGWLAVCLGLVATSGCDLLSSDSITTVIHAAHHGARTDEGKWPNYGEHEVQREFAIDTGWTVVLSDGFVVTTGIRVESCDGEAFDLDFPFGPYPEYWIDRDLAVTDFALGPLPKGEYCRLFVEYGRYQGVVAAMADDKPFAVRDASKVEGVTLHLGGYAWVPDGMGGRISHNFSFTTDQTILVTLDLSTLGEDGGPWRITGDEAGMRYLTVAKIYDEFFAGVDFANLDKDAFLAELPARLTAQTRVVSGPQI